MGKGTASLRTAGAVLTAFALLLLAMIAAPATAQTPTADQYGQPVPPANTPTAPGESTGTPPTGTDTGPGPGGTDTDNDTDTDADDGGSGTGDDGCNTDDVTPAGTADTCPEGTSPAADNSDDGTGSGGSLPIADSSGGLPFTGFALGAIVLVACLLLAGGLFLHSIQRWLGRRSTA